MYKDIGYINDWERNPPEIYQQCKKLGHEIKSSPGRHRNTSRMFCPICEYFYDVDYS